MPDRRIAILLLAATLCPLGSTAVGATPRPVSPVMQDDPEDATPEDPQNAAALEAGRQFTRQFLDGDHEALWASFAPEMKAAMGGHEASLAAFQLQVDSQLGAEAEVVSEVTRPQVGMIVYVRTVRYEKSEQLFEVSFTFPAGTELVDGTGPAGVIAGFLISPKRTEAPSDYLEYETKTELHLPFEGAWTVVWGGRTLEENYHTFTRDQRFAYDILIMKDDKTHKGDGESLEDYYCFGLPVLAPGAGVAVAAQDGVVDNAPGEMNPRQALGNHVIIDHGNGEYSFLAHLKKGSLAIEEGDRVEVGTLLGVCGNSGNTTEPHIHYHLQDTPDFGAGQGMPTQFQDYLLGDEPVERGEPVRLQVIRNQ